MESRLADANDETEDPNGNGKILSPKVLFSSHFHLILYSQ